MYHDRDDGWHVDQAIARRVISEVQEGNVGMVGSLKFASIIWKCELVLFKFIVRECEK